MQPHRHTVKNMAKTGESHKIGVRTHPPLTPYTCRKASSAPLNAQKNGQNGQNGVRS
jgi:hypothetical protein